VFRYPISTRASIGTRGSSADPQTIASGTRCSGRSTSTPGSSSSRTRRAGAGGITLAVAGLDALLERLAAQGIEHEPIERYSNGVRHVNVPDPDGNAIAFAEPPDAASASPRSVGTGASP
jgi:catechol 2,3-dioxygenase-like lactoylglutathione lyase family enzyme